MIRTLVWLLALDMFVATLVSAQTPARLQKSQGPTRATPKHVDLSASSNPNSPGASRVQGSDTTMAALLPPAAQVPEQKGLIAAKQQEFALAARYFEEARKHASSSPQVLFNLALAESKLPGRELRAIVWFEAYLAANPSAANASQVKEQISALEIKAEGNLERLVDAAQQAGYQFSRDSDKKRALGEVALARARSGDVSGARQLLTSTTEPSMLSQIVNAELELGQINAAKDVASLIPKTEEIWGPGANAEIAIAMARAGDLSAAQSVLANSNSNYHRHQGLIAIAKEMYAAGRKEEAFATLDQAVTVLGSMPKYLVSWNDYREVAQAQADIGDVQGVLRTAKVSEDPNNLVGSFGLYGYAISAAVKRGDLEAAARFLNLSPGRRQYDGSGMETALEGAFNDDLLKIEEKLANGDASAAHSLLSQIPNTETECSASYSSWFKLFSPNAIIVNQLSLMDWADAESRASHIPCPGDRISALLTMNAYVWDPGMRLSRISAARNGVKALPESDDKRLAVYSLVKADLEMGDMVSAETDIKLVSAPSDGTLDLIAMYQVKHRNTSGAISTLRKIDQEYVRANAVDAIVRDETISGDYAHALELEDGVPIGQRHTFSYQLAVNAKTNSSLLHQALLAPSLVGSSFVNKAADRDSFANDLARELAKRGMFDRARLAADSINDSTRRISAYIEIADVSRQFGNISVSDQFIASAQQIATMAPAKEQAEGLRRIAEFLITVRRLDAARRILLQALNVAKSISSPEKLGSLLETWNTLIDSLQSAGLFENAREASSMAADAVRSLDFDDSNRAWAGTHVAEVEAAQGNISEALRDIPTPESRDRILKTFALRQVGYRNFTGALETAKNIGGEYRVDIYRTATEGQVETNDLAAAERTLSLLDPAHRSDASGILATAFAQLRQFDSAARYVAYVPPEDQRSRVCSELANNGELDLAKRILLSIDDRIPWREKRGKCGIAVLEAMLRANDVSSVHEFVQSTARDETSYYLATLSKHGMLDVALGAYPRLSERGQLELMLAVAREGQASWVSEHLSDFPRDEDRDSILQALTIGHLRQGAFSEARQSISQIKDPLVSLNSWKIFAGYQLKAGEKFSALETMRVAATAGPGQDFESWAMYCAVSSSDAESEQDKINQRHLAMQISDPYWQSLALQKSVESEKEPQVLAAVARLVKDPLMHAALELQLVHVLVSKQRLAEAGATAATISDPGYRAMATSELVYAAIDLGKWPEAAIWIGSLPEGAAKAYLNYDVALARKSKQDGPFTTLKNAVRAAANVGDNYWRAYLSSDILWIAEMVHDQVATIGVRRLIEASNGKLLPDEQRMLAYHQDAMRSAEKLPAPLARTRVRNWSHLNESEYWLNQLLFIDLSAYLQSLSTKPTPDDIFRGLTGAVQVYSQKIREIRTFDPDKTM